MARLVSRFCSIFKEGTLNPAELVARIHEIDVNLGLWRDSIAFDHRPGNEVLGEPNEYQFILLVHMEYYCLTMAMFSALRDAMKLFPSQVAKAVQSHQSLRIRNLSSVLAQNGRGLLQALNVQSDTSHLRPNISCW